MAESSAARFGATVLRADEPDPGFARDAGLHRRPARSLTCSEVSPASCFARCCHTGPSVMKPRWAESGRAFVSGESKWFEPLGSLHPNLDFGIRLLRPRDSSTRETSRSMVVKPGGSWRRRSGQRVAGNLGPHLTGLRADASGFLVDLPALPSSAMRSMGQLSCSYSAAAGHDLLHLERRGTPPERRPSVASSPPPAAPREVARRCPALLEVVLDVLNARLKRTTRRTDHRVRARSSHQPS